MKRVTSRKELKHKVLLTLGHPYIRVDLSDEHLDLAIDTALRNFFKYSPYGSFESHYVYTVSEDDVERGYIPVPRNIDAVVEVIPTGMALTDLSFMTAEYQMQRNAYMEGMRYNSMALTDFVSLKLRLYNMQQVLQQPKGFEFVRYQRRLIPTFKITNNQVLAFRCYENVNPEKSFEEGLDPASVISSDDLWDDEVLKELVVAECKIIWGNILKKFGQVVLPGGVTLDGKAIYDEGTEEAAKIIRRMEDSNPIDFFMG